ncbi:MAG: hypothetical protein AAFU61_03550 [Pseudomonadota bacterium]
MTVSASSSAPSADASAPAPSRAALRRLMQGGSRPSPRLVFGPGAALAGGRAHEVCGPARRSFAAMAAGLTEIASASGGQGAGGPILWIRAPGRDGRLGPDGLSAFFNPGRLVVAAPRRAEDAPWCAEEALRSGACGLVVAELDAPLRLTPVRRLHLAAQAGAEAAAALGAPPPLALLLTGGAGGCEGVETRWHMTPALTCALTCAVPASPRSGAGAGTASGADARLGAGHGAAAAEDPGERSCAGPSEETCENSGGEVGAGAPGQGLSWAEGGAPIWRLELRRARLAPPRRWRLTWRPERRDGPARLTPDGAPDLDVPG